MAISVAQFAQVANWFTATSPQDVTGLSWSTGDVIVVAAATENSTTTITAVPTNANLTFAAVPGATQVGAGCNVYSWYAVAGSSQSSQTVTVTRAAGSGMFGAGVWVMTGATGVQGGAGSVLETTVSVNTPADAAVLYLAADFAATTANETPVTGSGTATERVDNGNTSNYGMWLGDWVGTAAGTFSFGMSSFVGWNLSDLVLVVTGTGVSVRKLADEANTNNATTYPDSQTVTPAPNVALLWGVWVHGTSTPTISSVSAYGVTWTQVATLAISTTARLSVYEGYSGSSPTASAATVTVSVAGNGCSWAIFEIANADTTDFTVQAPTNSGTGTTATVTFSALADGTNNAEVMFTGILVNATITPDATATWYELNDAGHNSPTARFQVQSRTGTDLTATSTWTGSAGWGAIGVEVAKVAVSAGTTVTPATVAVVATVDAPVLLGAAVIIADVVAVTVAIDTPSVGAPGLVAPAEVVAVVALPAPTILGAALVAPATVTLVATLDTVTISAGASVAPAEVVVTAALDSPTIDVTAGGAVSPATLAVTVAIDTPTILAAALVTPAEVAVTAALSLPTIDVSGAGLVTPAAVAVTVGIDTPTVTVAGLVTPDTVAVTTALPLPTIDVSGAAVVTPATVAVSLALDTPTVAGGATVTPATVAVVVSLPTPSAAVATTVTPATVTATATLPTPSYTAGGLVAVATVTVTVDVPQPTLEAEVAVDFYYEGGTALARHEGGALVGTGSGGALLAAVAGLSAVLVGAVESAADLLETEADSGYELPVTTGLTVWVDAAQLGLTDGVAVAEWPNLGSGGDGAIVGSPAPVYRAGILNGLPVVRFTAGEGRVRGTGMVVDGTWDLTVVYVTRMVGPGVGRIFTNTYPPHNVLVGTHTSGEPQMYDNGWVGNNYAYGPLPTPWRMYGCVCSEAPLLSAFYLDGAFRASHGTSSGHGNRWNLSGYDATGTEETCDCEVAELIAYNRPLDDDERQAVESYLVDKWGL